MTKKEELIAEIMAEFEKDDPVTREEAEEMAEMELKAKANGQRYEISKPKISKPKNRKVDEIKKYLFEIIIASLENEVENGSLRNEVDYNFDYQNENFTLKLTRHGNKKKK